MFRGLLRAGTTRKKKEGQRTLSALLWGLPFWRFALAECSCSSKHARINPHSVVFVFVVCGNVSVISGIAYNSPPASSFSVTEHAVLPHVVANGDCTRAAKRQSRWHSGLLQSEDSRIGSTLCFQLFFLFKIRLFVNDLDSMKGVTPNHTFVFLFNLLFFFSGSSSGKGTEFSSFGSTTK